MKTELYKLIDNNGDIVTRRGYALEGAGIFDYDGNEYIAGYSEDETLYANEVDSDNTVLNFQGERTRYRI